MKFIKTFEDKNCIEFDIIDNDEKIAYYVKYFVNPMTEEKLESPVFEMYYDFDGEEFLSSVLADSLEECLRELR